MRTPLAMLVLAIAPALAAQQPRTISPGMTRAQVIAALGQPLTLREADGYTYIFYHNQCTRACGMNDLVVLRSDSVVDAIFRSPERHYTGKSSSPEPVSPAAARRGAGAAPAAAAPRDSAHRLRIRPVPANDIRPSIPLHPPQLKPAPGTAPRRDSTPATRAPAARP